MYSCRGLFPLSQLVWINHGYVICNGRTSAILMILSQRKNCFHYIYGETCVLCYLRNFAGVNREVYVHMHFGILLKGSNPAIAGSSVINAIANELVVSSATYPGNFIIEGSPYANEYRRPLLQLGYEHTL